MRNTAIKLGLVALFLSFLGCATKPVSQDECVLPKTAQSHEDLAKSIQNKCSRGAIWGMARTKPDEPLESIDFEFIKRKVDDQLPMVVGVYRKSGYGLKLEYSANLPTPTSNCIAKECGYSIEGMPVGFVLIFYSKVGEHPRMDYKFLWENGDLKLIGKTEMVGENSLKSDSVHALCSRSYDFRSGIRLDRFRGEFSPAMLLPDQRILASLRDDGVRFEWPTAQNACNGQISKIEPSTLHVE